ncbi:MAG TPA: GTPase [Streptosporangiaceae bacterium]|nr:GTPase [Streptosporangiaceae bacterium]
MSARRQATPDRAADVGQHDHLSEIAEPAQAAQPAQAGQRRRPSGQAGNGEAAKNALPTRVPANRARSLGRALSGRAPAARAALARSALAGTTSGGAALAGPVQASGGTTSWSPGRANELTEQTQTLSTRLMALSRMVQIGNARSGRDGFSKKLLGQAEDVLGRAGERMRLSSAHTVVVLAGGTGSGKSSLFNRLAGADFSTVGVTRPITKDAHACIWDDAGSGALLEWLAVPQRNRYSRASALGGADPGLAGLVLLDLPDHDSVMGSSTGQVDRLVSLADVMIWVLDPQKYADAAVHLRFLIPLAGHSEVQAVVLNQADLLTSAQIDDCVADLRRLLDSENLHDVPILVTSAVTGSGLDDLRALLVKGVAARRSAAARILADVDTVVGRFAHYAGPKDRPSGSGEVPSESRAKLIGEFYAAAGVTAVGDALRSARELRAIDFVGWPVAWFAQRLSGRDPLRKIRLGLLWNDLKSVSAGPAGAQQAAIDNALNEFGDQLAGSLPRPWSHTVKAAAKSRAEDVPRAVGEAIGAALPAEDSVEAWWRLAGLWQGVLLGAVALTLAWLILVIVFGVFGVAKGLPSLLANPTSIAWAALAVAVALGTGAATASACVWLVRKQALAENTQIAADIASRIEQVARDLAVIPAEQELSEFERYRAEFVVAMTGVAAHPTG